MENLIGREAEIKTLTEALESPYAELIALYKKTNHMASTRHYITNTDNIPVVHAPISQAVVVGNHCYLSGQLSTDMTGKYVAGTVREEAERAFNNLFLVAEAAGFSRSELVFIDIAFIDLTDISIVNDLFSELFEEAKRPARTIYQAAALPYGGKIKVTAVGIKG